MNPTGLPQVVDELVGGAVTRQYTYGLDRISENQFVGGAWTPSFYGVDGGGSVRQLTNSSGTVTDTYEYDAFGNKVNSTGTTPNSYLYRGEQYDPDLSLYYLRARYYNQVTGRFLNVDSLAGQGQRRYEYAGANPVDGSDPSGNFVLASYWPQMAPLQIHIPSPKCSQGNGTSMGQHLPPCSSPPPCTKCRAQMKYRQTGPGRPDGRNGPQNHSFWYVQDRSGNMWNISAGIQRPSPYLQAWVYPPSQATILNGRGDFQDFSSSPTCFDSGSSCKVCDQVDKMIQFVNSWPKTRVLYDANGPNSNSFAHKVGTVGGFSPLSRPPGPFPTWGWDTPLN